MARRRKIEDIERDARAVELRRKNMTYRQIAHEIGYQSSESAYSAVQRGLLDAIQEPADEVRQMELDRLDKMSRAAWRILEDRHYAIANSGKVVLDPETGEPLTDDGPTLAAIDRLLKIQARRAKLLGLDAPVKAEVRHVDVFDADIARLVGELASGGQGPVEGHPEVLPVADPSQS